MKRIIAMLISIISANALVNAQILPTVNPYSIGPEGRSVEDLKDFAKPNQMVSILPNRPVVATDYAGNKQYYTSAGKLALTISKEGNITFSLNSISKTLDASGNLIKTEKNVIGTNIKKIENEFGEIISYKEMGFGGNVIREYDKDKNLTKTYMYDAYGKTVVSITNEMTKGKTVFNEKGLAIYDQDHEGNRMAEYEYDSNNKLILKTDIYGNKTHYDKNQNAIYVEDKEGIVISKYNYDYDNKGNYVLQSMYDPSTRETTYFKDGKQQYTKNSAGAVVIDYVWNGSNLVFTFNRGNQETSWYDIDGKILYVTFNEQIISKNLYYKGQLVGMWNARTNQVTVYKNERRELILQLEEQEEPTAEDVKLWIDAGLVEQKYL
jgi:predicted SpoU family rRNA methylase